MFEAELRSSLVEALKQTLEPIGFRIKRDSDKTSYFARETDNATELVFIAVQPKLTKKRVYFRFHMKIKEVEGVLESKFKTYKPNYTVRQASVNMTPRGSWETTNLKSLQAQQDEMASYIATHGLKWFQRNLQLETARDTILLGKFDDTAWWSWLDILAIFWMLKDRKGLDSLLARVKDHIENVKPDYELILLQDYERFRPIDLDFFPEIDLNRDLMKKTSSQICKREKDHFDFRIKECLTKSKENRLFAEPLNLYIILGNPEGNVCNEDSRSDYVEILAPLLDAIKGRQKDQSFTSSHLEGQFFQEIIKKMAPDGKDPPRLLFLAENQDRGLSNLTIRFNPTIILCVSQRQEQAIVELGETTAKQLAERVRAKLFAKQVRPYMLWAGGQNTGNHCPFDGPGELMRRGDPHRFEPSTDMLQGTWESLL